MAQARRADHDEIAYRMAWKAAHLFRKWFGNFPEHIGLDYRTRYREFTRERGDNMLTIIEPVLTPVTAPLASLEMLAAPSSFSMQYTSIRIDPLLFPDRAAAQASGMRVYLRVPDAVWCKRGEVTARLSLWFTESGWDAIMWDTWEKIRAR